MICLISVITEINTNDKVESSLQLPEIADPQKLGSCITYFRRYTLQSLLALEAEDDDGNKASESKIDEDTRPWLSEKQFKEAQVRISEGEEGVYEKLNEIFRMKKEYRNELKKLFA